jgi:hypothetical protein
MTSHLPTLLGAAAAGLAISFGALLAAHNRQGAELAAAEARALEYGKSLAHCEQRRDDTRLAARALCIRLGIDPEYITAIVGER